MNWYIGQRIVAVVNHSQGVFKKGDEFVLRNISNGLCPCAGLLLDIGVTEYRGFDRCAFCGIRRAAKDAAWWFSEKCFAPIQSRPEELSETTYEDIMTEIEELEIQTV